MKHLHLPLFICFILLSCNSDTKIKQADDRPTEQEVISAMKKVYEYTTTEGDVFKIEVNEVKIGNSGIANLKQELNNIPRGLTVTNVEVNYSYTGNISITKSARLWMYKDEFGEWKFKANSGG